MDRLSERLRLFDAMRLFDRTAGVLKVSTHLMPILLTVYRHLHVRRIETI